MVAPVALPSRFLPFIFLAALAAGAGAIIVAQVYLRRTPAYPDFLVGAITWQAATKFQDLASVPLFLLGFVAGGLGATRLFQQVVRNAKPEYERSLVTALTWWLVPLGIGLGGFFSPYPSSTVLAVALGAVGAILTAIAVRMHASSREVTPAALGLGIVAAMLIGLAPFAIATIQDRLPILSSLPRFEMAPRMGGMLFIAAALYLLYHCHLGGAGLSRAIERLLVIGQLCLTPFYLLLLPDLYLVESDMPLLQPTAWLWLLSAGLALVAAFDVLMRHRKNSHTQTPSLTRLLSPWALFGVILLLRLAVTAPPHVWADDYHFGESLVGWWSFWEYGKLPYIDYIPPHGIFGDDIGGFLSFVFYDGTAATIAEADRLAAALTMLVAFLALARATASTGLAFVGILLFGMIARKLVFLVIVPFFCFWVWRRSRRGHEILPWLGGWLISSVLLVLAVPAQGLIAVFATLPAVLLQLRHPGSLALRNLTLPALLAVALVVFTPLSAMLHGALRYIAENGPINQIAYGIPWSWSWSSIGQDKIKTLATSILDVFRMAWLWVPLIAVGLIVLLFRQRERWPYLIGVAVPVLLFASLMTPYAMGRIDPAAPSRPGLMTNFAFAILLPMLLAPILAARSRALLAVVIGFVCSGLGLANVSTEGFHSVVVRNEISNLWSGPQHGLRNMGTGIVEPEHADRLVRINAFLARQLLPQETYLDLTGRNAHYMYFDRPPPIAVTAPYNLASIEQQQRTVSQLAHNLPRLALLEAENMSFDGGGLALRNHLLYRFVLERYDAELHDGYAYGFAKGDYVKRQGVSFSVRELTDTDWLQGLHRSEAALVIRDSTTAHFLHVGDIVVLPDGQKRKIVRIWVEGNAIWLDGGVLSPEVVSQHRDVQVIMDGQRLAELSSALMQHVFAIPNLHKVPVAWGRSSDTLATAMKPVVTLDLTKPALHDLSGSGGIFQASGPDPYFWFDLSNLGLGGQSAGLLVMDVTCEGGTDPRIHVFWWGDGMQGTAANQSLLFTAAKGRLIVPLDAYPGWLELQQVKGLRVGLDTANACRVFTVSNASLQQRVNK